ncbi:hypothetical protein [Klebsiella pneumoniae]|uniref:hypothetical protein n=1 Tax=Klebsiella pneumoniae TaxID=573 RepID=UPI003F81E4DB
MFLMKSCEKEFNIKTLGSIRIGTLYGFRILENDEVRDILEGQYDYKISIKNSVIPIEVLLRQEIAWSAENTRKNI